MIDSIDNVRSTIVSELDIIKDDNHETHDGNSLTFYLPLDNLGRAGDLLDVDIEVIEPMNTKTS